MMELHVLVGQGEGGESLLQLASKLIQSGARLQVLYLMDSENETDWSTWMRKAIPLAELFLTRKELEKRLKELLSTEEEGARTYIAGEELFFQGMERICSSLGLKGDPVQRYIALQ